MIQTAIRLRFEDARALLHLADSVEDLGKEELRAVKELRTRVDKQTRRLQRVVSDAAKMQDEGLTLAGYSDAMNAWQLLGRSTGPSPYSEHQAPATVTSPVAEGNPEPARLALQGKPSTDHPFRSC